MATSDNVRAGKRAIRQRIGQLRRQLDRRVDAARRDTRRLIWWEERLRSRPWTALLAVFGMGTAMAKELRGAVEPECRTPDFSPKRLGQMAATLWQTVRRWQDLWATAAANAAASSRPSSPDTHAAKDGGAEDGGAEDGVAKDGVADAGVADAGVAEDGVAEDGVAEDGVAEDALGPGSAAEVSGGEASARAESPADASDAKGDRDVAV